jgi:pilus assembly protein Flp/PilA
MNNGEWSPRRADGGQGLVEYALILVLVAIVAIAILTILGDQIQTVFCSIIVSLGGDLAGSACASPVVHCVVESVASGQVVMQAVVTDPDGTSDPEDTIDHVEFLEDGASVRNEFQVEYCLGGGDDCSSQPHNTSSGTHTFSAVATDIDGNTGQCSVTVNVP